MAALDYSVDPVFRISSCNQQGPSFTLAWENEAVFITEEGRGRGMSGACVALGSGGFNFVKCFSS